VLTGALRLAGADNGLAVIAMGKHGADELNYSSDIDILLVASDAADVDPSLARSVVAIVRARFASTPISAPRVAPACSSGQSIPTSRTGTGGPALGSSRHF